MSRSPTLPPIELHVLEVEPLPASPRATNPQEVTPRDPLKRWREVAVRVMTQVAMGQDPFEGRSVTELSDSVVVDKKDGSGVKLRSLEDATKRVGARMPPIGNGTKHTKQRTQGKGYNVAWGNNPAPKTLTSSGKQSQKPGRAPIKKKPVDAPPKATGGGQKFASLVRLARFRKMSVRKNDEAKKEEEEEEEEEVVPEKPRFCTTMSAEAQYAMLKGYEDMLLNTLQTKVQSDRREALYRVRTPHKPVRSLYLTEQHLDEARNILPLNDNIHELTRQTSVPKIPQMPILPRPENSMLSGNFRDAANSTKEKQLRLTSRFERAHDILDSVRLAQGSLVTSPRALQRGAAGTKKKQKNALEHYNAWSHDWAREFRLSYGTKARHVTIE